MKNMIPCGCGCTPIFIGVMFFLAGIFAFIFVGGTFSISCERAADSGGYCKYQKDSFIDKSDKIINIADIKRVYLQESEGMKDDDGNTSTLYNVRIDTKSENIFLTPYASGGREVKAEIVDKMNAFLKDPSQKKVYVEQNDDGLGITIGLIACVIGAVLILFAIIIFVASIFFKTLSKI